MSSSGCHQCSPKIIPAVGIPRALYPQPICAAIRAKRPEQATGLQVKHRDHLDQVHTSNPPSRLPTPQTGRGLSHTGRARGIPVQAPLQGSMPMPGGHARPSTTEHHASHCLPCGQGSRSPQSCHGLHGSESNPACGAQPSKPPSVENTTPHRIGNRRGVVHGRLQAFANALAPEQVVQTRLNTSVPLVPPKPKLFLTATSIFRSLAVLAQ